MILGVTLEFYKKKIFILTLIQGTTRDSSKWLILQYRIPLILRNWVPFHINLRNGRNKKKPLEFHTNGISQIYLINSSSCNTKYSSPWLPPSWGLQQQPQGGWQEGVLLVLAEIIGGCRCHWQFNTRHAMSMSKWTTPNKLERFYPVSIPPNISFFFRL